MERPMRVKKVRAMCAVKGCGNRDTYYITRGGDFAGTPNLCADCLKRAYELIPEFSVILDGKETDEQIEHGNGGGQAEQSEITAEAVDGHSVRGADEQRGAGKKNGGVEGKAASKGQKKRTPQAKLPEREDV